jgi:PAS domain S-box-containing protein
MSKAEFLARRFMGYVIAVALIALASLVRWQIPSVFAGTPYLAFYPAVVAAAAIGGLGPGLVATVATALAVDLLFTGELGQSNLHDPVQLARTCVFLLGGSTMSVVAGMMRASRARERQLAEDRIRLLVEGVREYAIVMLDPHGNVASWNTGAQRIKGYSADQIVGRHFSCFYPPEDVAAGKPQRELAIAAEQGQFAEEGWRIRRDGSRFWASVTLTAIRSSNGQLQGFGKVTRDMTEQKEAEQKVQQAVNELSRSNAELQQFAYVASHDLQEPLRAITGCVQLLQHRFQGKLDARGDEFINHAVEGATRMKALITDLLEYSRAGTAPTASRPTDLNRVFQAALRNLQTAIAEKKATVTSDQLPTLVADETRLMQVLQNLIGNALKFTGETPPQIHVGAKHVDGAWQFSVRDNGIGIEPQYAERIFGVFQRLHARREYPGTGIGLAICKRVVERHGGRIWVESEPGKGSTFHFLISERSSV